MSYANGPKIVTDGLVLCLDAANRKSYPGTGTAWNDLSGNSYNGTLTNGATYQSLDNGRMSFDGINDLVSLSTTTFSTSGPWTILFWVRFNDLTIHMHLTGVPNQDTTYWAPLSHYGAGLTDYKQAWWDSNGWRYSSTSMSNNKWHQVGLLYDGDNTITFILDNGYDNSTSGSSYFNPIARIGSLGYRQHSSDRFFYGQMSSCKLYLKALSADEISQNYNALKGRYGLT